MPKKRKLNSKNPKYWPTEKVEQPIIKERKLIKSTKGIKVYALFLEN